jgi:predicted heme/steroid binding protein
MVPDQIRVEIFLRHLKGGSPTRARQRHHAELCDAAPAQRSHCGNASRRADAEVLVADNDLAVGRAVEAISHSPFWDDTAFFVLEDDAQDGGDHVDAHRSIALVISKYAPHGPTARRLSTAVSTRR